MAEREEMHKREAEDQKKKEEEEERKLEQKRLRVGDTSLSLSHMYACLHIHYTHIHYTHTHNKAAEIRRESRPQHLEELLKMDLDSVSIRAIKDIMIRMGISPHDCFERRDLKKKLVDNVPELRMAMERRASISSQSSTASFTTMGSSSSFSGKGQGSFMSAKGDSLVETSQR